MEELPDEVLGKVGGVEEELLVEAVVHGHDVGKGLLLAVPQERGRSRQPGK